MSILKSLFSAQGWIRPFEFLFERVLAYTAALAMFTMMLVTLVDVVGRDLFSAPLPGGFEVTELLLASLIFLGLPMVTAEGSHVDVDIMDSTIPAFLKPLQDIAICLVNLVAFATLSWMMWKLAFRTYEYQDTTAMLQIPYAGLVFLMAVCCTLSTWALMLMLLFKRGKKLFSNNHGDHAVKEVK
ncbi:TRAP transporter small permease [uncultured Amphritea sp.]|uniref:TRAP transporter small permease n=1 Tax=uncultured Amphritea sp. TaxID=981605 RepID=UPI002635CA96|nr:TRAP transporter small permease [uncultured Amphritea sp.]